VCVFFYCPLLDAVAEGIGNEESHRSPRNPSIRSSQRSHVDRRLVGVLLH